MANDIDLLIFTKSMERYLDHTTLPVTIKDQTMESQRPFSKLQIT
jgi:hypothetical protein